MRRPYQSRPLNPLFAPLCALALALMAHPIIVSAGPTSPNGLEVAWERARQVGAYTFTADVEQTLVPRALPGMIGETDQRVDVRIEGEVSLPDHARLRLRFEGAGLDATPVEVVQEGVETYVLKDGERIPIENPSGITAPTGDYLGYLVAATNVRTEGQGYAFDVDGSRFAAYVRDQLQAQIDETGKLNGEPAPPGTTLSPAPHLQRMSGHGELWVDAAGLPRRQTLDLTIPQASEEYDAHARIVVDFYFDHPYLRSQTSDSTPPNLPISNLQSPD